MVILLFKFSPKFSPAYVILVQVLSTIQVTNSAEKPSVAADALQEEAAPTASDAERETDAFRRAAEDIADLD